MYEQISTDTVQIMQDQLSLSLSCHDLVSSVEIMQRGVAGLLASMIAPLSFHTRLRVCVSKQSHSLMKEGRQSRSLGTSPPAFVNGDVISFCESCTTTRLCLPVRVVWGGLLGDTNCDEVTLSSLANLCVWKEFRNLPRVI